MTTSSADPDSIRVASVLRTLGYDVRHVARTLNLGGSCDLDAVRGDERLLFEVKTWRTPEQASEMLVRGRAAVLGGRIDRTDRDVDKLTKAARQLSASAVTTDAVLPSHLVWSRLHSPGDQHARLRLFTALYGVSFRRIISGPRLGIANLVPCFEARRPAFRDMLEVSGVVVESTDGVGLWTNPWSLDVPRLLESHLCQALRRFRAVFHVPDEESPESLYVVDEACLSEEEVASSLNRKYGVTTVPGSSESTTSTSTAWPGNECGQYTPIPGADRVVPHWQLAVALRGRENGM